MEYIGIIGTGARAATWYFQKYQELYQFKYGKNAVCPLKRMNIPFEPINRLLPSQMEKAGLLLIPYFLKMSNLKVSRFILANITLHEAIDLLKYNLIIPSNFISLKNVITKHWNPQIKKAMILGTYYTMQNYYLPSLFNNFVVTFITPNEEDFSAIDRLRTMYYTHSNPDTSEKVFDRLKKNYPEVDCFIIACTEHALALADYNGTLNVFNLPELQCADLIESEVH